MASRPENKVTVITSSTGYARIAADLQIPLVPCLSFHEHLVFGQYRLPVSDRVQRWFKQNLGLYLFIPRGLGFPPVLPNFWDNTVVIGRPIFPRPLSSSSTPEEIRTEAKRLHRCFYEQLFEIAQQYREHFGQPNFELVLSPPVQGLPLTSAQRLLTSKM